MSLDKGLVFLVCAFLLAGCGGGDGGDSKATDETAQTNQPAAPVEPEVKEPVVRAINGYFVDSPVEGLRYETDTRAGTTDSIGLFTYMAGETVRFYLGDLLLGEATGQFIMTPLDLETPAGMLENRAVNIARLLLSLDEDRNSDNGLQIEADARVAFTDLELDLTLEPEAFAELDQLQDALEWADVPMFVSKEYALNHLDESLARVSGIQTAFDLQVWVSRSMDGYDGIELPAEVSLENAELPAETSLESIRTFAAALWRNPDEPAPSAGWVSYWLDAAQIEQAYQDLLQDDRTSNIYHGKNNGSLMVKGSLDDKGELEEDLTFTYNRYSNDGITIKDGVLQVKAEPFVFEEACFSGASITVTGLNDLDIRTLDQPFHLLGEMTVISAHVDPSCLSDSPDVASVTMLDHTFNLAVYTPLDTKAVRLDDLRLIQDSVTYQIDEDLQYTTHDLYYSGKIFVSTVGSIDVVTNRSVPVDNRLTSPAEALFSLRAGDLYFLNTNGVGVGRTSFIYTPTPPGQQDYQRVKVALLALGNVSAEKMYEQVAAATPAVNVAPQPDSKLTLAIDSENTSLPIAADVPEFNDPDRDEFEVTRTWLVNDETVETETGTETALDASHFGQDDVVSLKIVAIDEENNKKTIESQVVVNYVP